MSMTSIAIRKDDHRPLKADAESFERDLVDFVPILHRAWRKLSRDEQWATIQEAIESKREGNKPRRKAS